MATANIERAKPVKMMIGGSEVIISFTVEPNPAVAAMVKKALLDSYLQRSNAHKE